MGLRKARHSIIGVLDRCIPLKKTVFLHHSVSFIISDYGNGFSQEIRFAQGYLKYDNWSLKEPLF